MTGSRSICELSRGDAPRTTVDRVERSTRRTVESVASECDLDRSDVTGNTSVGIAPESTVSFGFLQAIGEAVEQAGVPREELLRVAGFTAEQPYDVDQRMPLREVYRVCELALDLTGDPALGLHWGERHTPNAFGPFTHLVEHASSLREGLDALSEYRQLIGDKCGFRVLEQDGEVRVSCLPLLGTSSRMRRFAFEITTVGFYRLGRCFDPHTRPLRVCFSFDAPAYRLEYSRVFDREVYFRQPFTEIAFDSALLDLPSPYKDAGVHEALRTLVKGRMARLKQQSSYTQRVHQVLTQQACSHRTNMDTVARSLGLSVRSLRRRLASEQKSYHEIDRDAQESAAKEMLRNRLLTIQDIAYQMGFSSPTAFHRAFKRWTGMTPTAFRNMRSEQV